MFGELTYFYYLHRRHNHYSSSLGSTCNPLHLRCQARRNAKVGGGEEGGGGWRGQELWQETHEAHSQPPPPQKRPHLQKCPPFAKLPPSPKAPTPPSPKAWHNANGTSQIHACTAWYIWPDIWPETTLATSLSKGEASLGSGYVTQMSFGANWLVALGL